MDRLDQLNQAIGHLEAQAGEILGQIDRLKTERAILVCPYEVGETVRTTKGGGRNGNVGWLVSITEIIPYSYSLASCYAIKGRRVLKGGKLAENVVVVDPYDIQGVAP